jgi:hypothetical protein
MNSSHALELTRQIIQNDLEAAEPLLKLLDAFIGAEKTRDEAMTRDVMLFLYTKTDHCEESMRKFISQDERDRPLAA